MLPTLKPKIKFSELEPQVTINEKYYLPNLILFGQVSKTVGLLTLENVIQSIIGIIKIAIKLYYSSLKF